MAGILQAWGKLERDRQERQLTNTILQGIASGKDFQQVIAEVLQEQQNPSYGGGLAGGFQRFSSGFAPPSDLTRILAGMGLAQTTPQAQAEVQGTQALTQQRRTATKGTKQEMRRAKAREPLTMEKANVDLENSRQQLAELKRANDPAFQEYDHYNRLALMSLNRLRYGNLLPEEPEYQELTQQYNEALRQMQEAWKRFESRSGTTAPGEAATQAPAAAQPWGEVMPPSPGQQDQRQPGDIAALKGSVGQRYTRGLMGGSPAADARHGKVRMVTPKGLTYDVPAAEVAEAESHGWRRVP
ncbi:MAG: hypothetical protein OEV33_00055 [Armatimonadota bacterium]|nr:hypothetical protein [Armatimonadota bacterium]